MAKIEGLTTDKVEKKVPVKAQPKTDKDGGVFTSKIVAIWNKIFGR